MIISLEDQAFFSILKNFENLLDNCNFKAQLQRIPLMIRERIFSGLNRFHGRINENILEVFSTESLALSNINVTFVDVAERGILKFFLSHKFKNLKVRHANIFTVKSLLEEMNKENLRELQVQSFEDRFYFPTFFGYSSPNTGKLSSLSSHLKNLSTLHVPGLKLLDGEFFDIMRSINTFEDIDIARTNVKDIRSLKYQMNLKYLDCSELYWIAGANYVHLHCLKKLKFLKFGNSETHTPYLRIGWSKNIPIHQQNCLTEQEKQEYLSVPERFSSTKSWNMSNFLKLSSWNDLEFFDLVGNWRPTRSSIL